MLSGIICHDLTKQKGGGGGKKEKSDHSSLRLGCKRRGRRLIMDLRDR